ncbi:MAG: polysaccharide pyruvyl transferase family protein, partial [Pseudomonadota bacterium]
AVGLALRGPQSEYGDELCMWRETEQVARRAAGAAAEIGGGAIIDIENHLARANRAPADIEKLYAGCGLVITSRFHGAIEALRHKVPFIAIDQIRGGAKVYDLLANKGWPHVHRIDEADEAQICRDAADLVRAPDLEQLLNYRNTCIHEANRTLGALDGVIEALPIRS